MMCLIWWVIHDGYTQEQVKGAVGWDRHVHQKMVEYPKGIYQTGVVPLSPSLGLVYYYVTYMLEYLICWGMHM